MQDIQDIEAFYESLELMLFCEEKELIGKKKILHTWNVLRYADQLMKLYVSERGFDSINHEEYRKVLFAAVLHDIGKSDKVKKDTSEAKEEHPQNAQKYIIKKGKKLYKYLNESLSDKDIQDIGIIAGSHNDGTPTDMNGQPIEQPNEQLEIGCSIVCCADKLAHIEEDSDRLTGSIEKICRVPSKDIRNAALKLLAVQK